MNAVLATQGSNALQFRSQRVAPVWIATMLLISTAAPGRAGDPEIDRLLQSPVAKDWVTNGGNLTNQRYSTLAQIDRNNVKQLNGAWMTRLKGSGLASNILPRQAPS
jgi:glucose dehydrogenase